MDKKIHVYYINKIKELDRKIFEYEDDDCPNFRAVNICERHIEKWLDKAGITDKDLRQEIRRFCAWHYVCTVKYLENKGWQILYGKENFYDKTKN